MSAPGDTDMTSATASPDAAPLSEAAARKTSIWIRLWPAYLIASALGAAWYFGLFDLFSLAALRENYEGLRAFVDRNPVLAYGSFIAVYALTTTIMIPGALWVTIAGGLMFGLLGGTIATVTGATLGASILFFAAKTSLGSALRRMAGTYVRKIEGEFKENQVSYMFAMRFVPAMPFPIANIVPALLGAKYHWYLLTTALGIVPGVLAYTWIGAGAGAVFASGEELDLAAVARQLIPAGIALGVVSLLPVAYKKVFGRKAAARLEEGAPR